MQAHCRAVRRFGSKQLSRVIGAEPTSDYHELLEQNLPVIITSYWSRTYQCAQTLIVHTLLATCLNTLISCNRCLLENSLVRSFKRLSHARTHAHTHTRAELLISQFTHTCDRLIINHSNSTQQVLSVGIKLSVKTNQGCFVISFVAYY